MSHTNLIFYETPIFHDAYITNTTQIDNIECLFPIHKVFLASKSEVFKTLFKNYEKPLILHEEDQKPIYYVGEKLSSKCLDLFLRYFYLTEGYEGSYYVEPIKILIEEEPSIIIHLCDLFERYSIECYKTFMLYPLEQIQKDYPEKINTLIGICMLYGLDLILNQIMTNYLNTRDDKSLDLTKHTNIIINIIYNYITNIDRHYIRYKICNFLSKHESMNSKIKYTLFSKLDIDFYRITYDSLIECNLYDTHDRAILRLIYEHYRHYKSRDRGKIINSYPLILNYYVMGQVSDINIKSDNLKIIINNMNPICNTNLTYKINYIVFVSELSGSITPVEDIFPLELLKSREDPPKLTLTVKNKYEDIKLTQEDVVKLIDTIVYYCFV